MKITPINTIKYTPISFKAENTLQAGSYTTAASSNSDTFEKSAESAPSTVNNFLTSFKKLFSEEPQGKTTNLSDQELSDLIYSRNMLL